MVFALDDTALGPCPVDSAAVASGAHVLRGWPVEGRKFSSGSITRDVFVKAGDELVIDLSEIRWVRVETEPFGADVTRGGVPLGETPLVVAVMPGDPPLIVEKSGFCVTAMTAGALLSGPSTLRVKLEPGPTESAGAARAHIASPARPRLSPSTVLLGVAVVVSATAAVALNSESDDAFEEYRTTGNLKRMNELFGEAERLDSWAVASWIVSEAALGILLYRLLGERKAERADDSPIEEPP